METPAETEQWKEISGFEGIYQISNHGRLKKLKGYARDMGYPRLVSVKHKGGWYLTVTLRHGPKRWTVRIHVLVAQAFVPNFESKPEVNHKDLNKQNNYADNLEWVTKKENVIHAVFHKPEIVCAMNYYNQFVRPKTIEQLSFDGKIIAEFRNSEEAQKATGVCQRNILQVANKTEYKPGLTRRQAGGFVWRFKNEVQVNSEFERGELLPCTI